MSEFEIFLLVTASFASCILSVLAGFGGSILLVSIATIIFPANIAIPIIGAIVVGTELSRFLHFFVDINWNVARPFALGSVIGALVGAQTFALMSESMLILLLAIAILLILWLPAPKTKVNFPYLYLWIGIVHTWVSTVTGVGGILQGTMLRSDYTKRVVVGTLAGSLLTMTVMKIVGYLWIGFDFKPYLLGITLSIVTGFVGTWVGKRYIHIVSDQQFRFYLKWALTLVAIRLLWVALAKS